MAALVAYNSDPVIRELAEDGSLVAAKPSFVDFYTAFGVDVLGGNVVVLAYDNTSNDLTFYTLDPTDLSIVSSVPMDPAWGSISGGSIWGSNYLPMAIDTTHNLITVVYEGGFRLVQFDATTGLHVDDLAVTMVANAEPNLPLIVFNHTHNGYWVNRRNPSAGNEVAYLVPIDGSGHVTSAGMTEPTWSTDDLDTVIHDSLDPVDQNEIMAIQGLRELPNGHLLITGENGSAVEVDVSDGTIVNFIKPDHFIGHESVGLGLDSDGLSYWTTFNGTPTSVGLPPPSGGAGGDFDAWVAKIAMADGSVGGYYAAHPSASPLAVWAGSFGPPPPVARSASDAAPAQDLAFVEVFSPWTAFGSERDSNQVLLTIDVPTTPPPSPPPPPAPPPPLPIPPPPIVTQPRPRRRRKPNPVGRVTLRNVNPWGSDVPVSRPESPSHPVTTDFGGIAMTTGGLAHNINDEIAEELFTPTYSPLPNRSEDG